LALLRSRVADLGGKSFCDAREAEMRHILDNWDHPALRADAEWEDAPAADGYAVWASTYDAGPNVFIDLDESVLGPMLSHYRAGEALDAACGTGR
jgi:hypothetical protein